MWKLILGTGTLAALSGCTAINQYQKAETLGEGNHEVGVDASMYGVSGGGAAGGIFTLVPNVTYRYGVSDTFDIGGRFGFSGLELLLKWMLADGDDVKVSIAPTLGGFAVGSGGTSVGFVDLGIPVLIGIPTGNGGEVVIGPREQTYLLFGSGAGTGGSATVIFLGSTFGYSAPVSDSFRIHPEIGFLFPAVASASVGGTGASTASFGGGFIWSVGAGFAFE